VRPSVGPAVSIGSRTPSFFYSADVEPVQLTVVANEIEAEVVCGLLRENGIRCAWVKGNVASAISAASGGFAIDGPTEILVDPDDLDAANEVLARR
jgi:Putative prokaryotic signal transducing protein